MFNIQKIEQNFLKQDKTFDNHYENRLNERKNVIFAYRKQRCPLRNNAV